MSGGDLRYRIKALALFAARGAVIILVLGLAVAVYIMYAAVWGASEPAWAPHEDRIDVLGCYSEEDDDDGEIIVQFLDGGHRAIVDSHGERAEVFFEAGGMAGDRYQGNNVTFVYDGEGYVAGMKGGNRGPCQ